MTTAAATAALQTAAARAYYWAAYSGTTRIPGVDGPRHRSLRAADAARRADTTQAYTYRIVASGGDDGYGLTVEEESELARIRAEDYARAMGDI